MIVGLRGALAATGPDWVHVTVGGVTLQVFVPSNSISALGSAGSMVSLHTILRIREEQPILYGFPDDASVQLFTLLTGVSGVGPRLALALLSSTDSASLQFAVASGDAAALAAAPGVGRRIATGSSSNCAARSTTSRGPLAPCLWMATPRCWRPFPPGVFVD